MTREEPQARTQQAQVRAPRSRREGTPPPPDLAHTSYAQTRRCYTPQAVVTGLLCGVAALECNWGLILEGILKPGTPAAVLWCGRGARCRRCRRSVLGVNVRRPTSGPLQRPCIPVPLCLRYRKTVSKNLSTTNPFPLQKLFI
jgi:hypothetical protein